MSKLVTPIKAHYTTRILGSTMCFGGGDGNRTHVHNNFQTTSTNYFTASVCLPLRLFFNNFNHSFLTNGISCSISASYSFLISSFTFIFRPTTCFIRNKKHYTTKNSTCQSSVALGPHLARLACVSLPKSTGHS